MKRLVLVLLFIVVFGVVFTSGVFGFGDSEDPESNEWDAGEPRNWKYRYLYYDNGPMFGSSSTAAAHTVPYPVGLKLTFDSYFSGYHDPTIYTNPEVSFQIVGYSGSQHSDSVKSKGSKDFSVIIPANHYLKVGVKGGEGFYSTSSDHTRYFWTEMEVTADTSTVKYDRRPPDDKGIFQFNSAQIDSKYIFNSSEIDISLSVLDIGSNVDGYWLNNSLQTGYSLVSGIAGYNLWITEEGEENRLFENYFNVSELLSVNIIEGYNNISLPGGSYELHGEVFDKMYDWVGNSEKADHAANLISSSFYIDAEGPVAPTKFAINNGSNTIEDVLSETGPLFFTTPLTFSIENTDVPADRGHPGAVSGTIPDGIIEITGEQGTLYGQFTFGEEINLLPDGEYTAAVFFEDQIGNQGETTTIHFSIDNYPPQTPILLEDENFIIDPQRGEVVYIPLGEEDALHWLPAVDGSSYTSEPELWQSGLEDQTYRVRITQDTSVWTDQYFIHQTGVEEYSMDLPNLPKGDYTIKIDIGDKVGNAQSTEYILHVDLAPEPPTAITLTEETDGYYIVWDHPGGDGYTFDIRILKGATPVDLLDTVLVDTVTDWQTVGMRYKLPENLLTKVPCTVKVYVRNASGFPMPAALIFRLPNIPAEDFTITFPENHVITGSEFPLFSIPSGSQDDEGDLLGLRLFYRHVGSGTYTEIDPGLIDGVPATQIDMDTSSVPIPDHGIYEWYLGIVEYFSEWDNSGLTAWHEFVRWPADGSVLNFAVDANAPSGLLTANEVDESTIELRAFAFYDGSGPTSSGVSEIVLWNDSGGGWTEIIDYDPVSGASLAADVIAGAAVRIPVLTDEITVSWWPFVIDGSLQVAAKMIVIDAVGNESGPVSVTNPDNNSAPIVTVITPEVTVRVGETRNYQDVYDAYDSDGDSLSYSWNFGDGTGGEGEAPEKTYTEAGDHTVLLTVSDWWNQETIVQLTVHVTNTSEGVLLMDETWSGTHLLEGLVTVPAGFSLNITAGTVITALPDAGLHINEGAVLFVSGESSGIIIFRHYEGENPWWWDGIRIEGSGTIENLLVKGAFRGITAGPNSDLTISDSWFEDNRIGLHISGASAELSDCYFLNNQWYGIKEDEMLVNEAVRPYIGTSDFSGNGHDYYHEELLNLSGIELDVYKNNQE